MSNTPAAQIARLKTTYPGWSIRQVQRGRGYTAHRRDRTGQMRKIYGSTPGQLASKLQAPSG